jgi:beta-mannosidase
VAAESAVDAKLKARITLMTPNGKTRMTVDCPLINGQGTAELSIKHPQLWWPAGLGAHPLYTVQVGLEDTNHRLLDTTQKRIGLRTMQVWPETNSTSMQLVVNGKPFFAKGANWIPADAFPTRLTPEKLRQYMADAAAANMNTLRFWGGGYYEDDALFDACDELGICVWLDFKFGCSTYPAFDPAFVENVRQEAAEQVKRLRHHPSIAVWCGNNEIMFFRGGDQWTQDKMSAPDYYHLFRDVLGGVMRSLAPQSDYVTGSPDCGDVHFWEVWHGGKSFDAYRDIHGFISEFGFQSFPVPATVAAFTTAEDRTNIYSPIIKYHMRSNRMYLGVAEDGQIGTDKMMHLVRMNFREPKDFESTLWLSQINQAYGIGGAAENWRREMPRSMGCVYWQLNDDWPGTSWSSMDYFGRWKALQYCARRFYAPILVSGDFDATHDQVAVWLSNDELNPVRGKLSWEITDLAGKQLLTATREVSLEPQHSSRVQNLEVGKLRQQYGTTNLLVWLTYAVHGQTTSCNVVLLAKPRELQLSNPELTWEVSGEGTDFTVTVRAQHPALWVWLDLGAAAARWSDNFLPIGAGGSPKITVKLTSPMSRADFVNALKVRSLFDTYVAE